MDERVKNILERASHPNTGEGERANAMKIFYTLAQKAGGMDKLFGGTPRASDPPAYVPYSAQREEVMQLKAELAAKTKLIAQLEADLCRVGKMKERKPEVKKSPIAPDGTMEYTEFYREVQRRLVNRDRSWQMGFEEQTGLTRDKFPTFGAKGRVSAEYVKALDKLTEVPRGERRFRDWTLAEVNMIRRLTDVDGRTEKYIASLLSAQLNERITVNMLKRLKLNSRDGSGVFRNPAFGGSIGKKRED